MERGLFDAVQRLQASVGKAVEDNADFIVDDILLQAPTRKRARRDTDKDGLRSELEKLFLSPPAALNDEWPDRLQQ